jgi:hypothetical protein
MNLVEEFLAKNTKHEHLQERLVSAELNDLMEEMSKDEKLCTFLNTEAKDLPENYRYLIQEITKYEDKTLLDLIKTSLEWNIRVSKINCFFSKAGEKIVGFTAYVSSMNKVTEIKTFSFNSERTNPVILGDLKNLLEKLLHQFKSVHWTAMKKNKANFIYQRAIDEYGEQKFFEFDEKEISEEEAVKNENDDEIIIHYHIESKKL